MSSEDARPLVRLERRGAVALVTIDHPPVNILSAAVLDALTARLNEVESDPELRVVVLNGASEKAFAAGANIREMANMGPDEARLHGARGQGVTVRIESLPLPVIAAVHGACLGGGCEIALACDLVIASDDAVFGQPEINLGVMPGWGGTQRLPRRIGTARARAAILTGKPMTAAEVESWGWIYRVVPRSELLSTALELAAEVAQKPSVALAAAKFSMQQASDPSLDEGLEFELELWARLFGTRDQKAGMAAFLEKKKWTAPEPRDTTEHSRALGWADDGGSTTTDPGAKRKN